MQLTTRPQRQKPRQDGLSTLNDIRTHVKQNTAHHLLADQAAGGILRAVRGPARHVAFQR